LPVNDLVRAAARAEFAMARPLPHNAFKIDLATDLIAAVVADITGRDLSDGGQDLPERGSA